MLFVRCRRHDMRFLDTNVIVRYLVKDDQVKAEACFQLFKKLEQGTEELTTCEAVIAEVVYVLSSRALYGLNHEEIRARLTPILTLKGLRLPQKRLYLKALDLYAIYSFLDFEDALCVVHMENEDTKELYSYDTDFDRIPGIRRIEP